MAYMRSVLEMDITPETVETVQDTVTTARIVTLLKENRLELIGLTILAHLLGLSDRIIGHLNGVCF